MHDSTTVVCRTIENRCRDATVCRAEHLEMREIRHLMQVEDARAVGSEKDTTAAMKCCSCNLGSPQLKILPSAEPPLASCSRN